MANIDKVIRDKIESFVQELAGLVRQAAVQSVTEAFGAGVPAPRRGRPRAERAERRAKGQKRAPAALEKLTEDLAAAIKATPGLRIEQIAKELGTPTKELALPARKLIAAKKIKTRGQRRATKYFPA
jgi:hypothetical protein